MTNMTYSSAVSSMGSPLSPFQKGTRRERHFNPESTVVKAAAPSIDMVSVVGNRRPTTLIIDNTPEQNKRGIYKGQTFTTTTVNGSLVQKPVTVAEGNQGSCDKNPVQAVTTDKMDAIVGKNGGPREVSVSQRDDGAKSGQVIVKGGRKPAAGKMVKVQLAKGNLAPQKYPWPKPHRCNG
jgi:hypothetical protein